MRASNPLPISILYERESGSIADAAALERIAHGRAMWKRLEGEWFDISLDDAIAAIEEVMGSADLDPPKLSPMKVADALRKSRVSAGLTQRQVAEMLGVTPQFMSDIEQGRRALGEKYLHKLPDAIRASVISAMVNEHKSAIARIYAARSPIAAQ